MEYDGILLGCHRGDRTNFPETTVESFRGAKIPTVEEFLEEVSKTDTVVNWELKEWPMDHGVQNVYQR